MEKITPVDALMRAIDIAGGRSALAEKLPTNPDGSKVSTARIWNWVNRDGGAPASVCPDIEAITGVKCEELCPGTNWAVLRGTDADQAKADAAQEGNQQVAQQCA